MGSPEVQRNPLSQAYLLKGIFGNRFAGPGSYKALVTQRRWGCLVLPELRCWCPPGDLGLGRGYHPPWLPTASDGRGGVEEKEH